MWSWFRDPLSHSGVGLSSPQLQEQSHVPEIERADSPRISVVQPHEWTLARVSPSIQATTGWPPTPQGQSSTVLPLERPSGSSEFQGQCRSWHPLSGQHSGTHHLQHSYEHNQQDNYCQGQVDEPSPVHGRQAVLHIEHAVSLGQRHAEEQQVPRKAATRLL
jgi:hypothetical protein